MNDILTKIRQADDMEIDEIIDAITQRYQQAHPGWEIAFLALPRNDPEAGTNRGFHTQTYVKTNSGHPEG